jgi:tRNA-splicing ligase RtcB
MLDAEATDRIHNHHNFAWWEDHGGRRLLVHRKGATPAFPGQRGFVGGTMGEPAVILEGVDAPLSVDALYSTVHGAGRVLSRTQAAGKFKGWGRTADRWRPAAWTFLPGRRAWPRTASNCAAPAPTKRPECYKRLSEVLAYHGSTVRILHTLRPIGVAMAGRHEFDPFKD